MTQKGIVIQLGKPHAHRNWIWILDFFIIKHVLLQSIHFWAIAPQTSVDDTTFPVPDSMPLLDMAKNM